MKSIQNIKDILILLDSLAGVTDDVLSDDKVDFWDIPKFLKVWPELKAAIDDAKEIGEEIKDLDREEIQEIGIMATEVIVKWSKVFGKKKSSPES